MKVNFRTIAWGVQSGYPTDGQILIDNPKEWTDVWQQHTSNLIPSPPLPIVDFTDNQVVAVFMEEHRTSGYSVEILTIETTISEIENLTSLIITVAYRQPAIGDIVQEVITRPYHIIRIPRFTGNEFVFEKV